MIRQIEISDKNEITMIMTTTIIKEVNGEENRYVTSSRWNAAWSAAQDESRLKIRAWRSASNSRELMRWIRSADFGISSVVVSISTHRCASSRPTAFITRGASRIDGSSSHDCLFVVVKLAVVVHAQTRPTTFPRAFLTRAISHVGFISVYAVASFIPRLLPRLVHSLAPTHLRARFNVLLRPRDRAAFWHAVASVRNYFSASTLAPTKDARRSS